MKSENRLMRRLLLGSALIILILCGATFGLSLTAAELSKETKTEGGVMVDASTKKPVATTSTKSSVPLLKLADPATPDSTLLSIKQLTLEATSGEMFGVSIQDY